MSLAPPESRGAEPEAILLLENAFLLQAGAQNSPPQWSLSSEQVNVPEESSEC